MSVFQTAPTRRGSPGFQKRGLGWVVATLLALAPLQALAAPYLAPGSIELLQILPPPPAADSARNDEDLSILLDLQARRTPQDVAQANADVVRKLVRFSDVVGTDLSPARAPLANALIDKATEEGVTLFLTAKAVWQRPRPYVAYPGIIRLVVPPEDTFSYPSGHSTFGMGTAIILARMVPEKAGPIFQRGREFGHERALAGVHYPSDVEAGRITATVIVAMMLQNVQFQADLAAAATEVRGLLGLGPLSAPAAPPR